MKLRISILAILAATLVFTSCKKEKEEIILQDDALTVDVMKIDFNHTWDDEAFAYNTEYDINGVSVRFLQLKYYLSDFTFHDMGGNMQEMINKAILVDAGSIEMKDLGVLDFPHVHEMMFLLGLNEDLNHADPTLAEYPLNDAEMHWSWNPDMGYKFVKIESERDLDGDGTFEAESIHVATDALKRSIEVMVHQDAIEGELIAQMNVDYSALFTGVDISAETLEGTHGASDLTNAIVDAAQAGAFEVE